MVCPHLALNQNQPLGNDRFYAEIEAVTGQRLEPRKRGRPKKRPAEDRPRDRRQQELPIESPNILAWPLFLPQPSAHRPVWIPGDPEILR